MPKAFHKGFPKWHRDYNDLAKAMLDKAQRMDPKMNAEKAAQELQRIADKLLKYAEKCQSRAGY